MASTLLELRIRVLGMLNDLEDPNTGLSGRYNLTIVNGVINDCIVHYANLIRMHYQGYLKSSVSIDVLASVNSYSLGSSFRSPIYEVRRTIDNIDRPLMVCPPYNKAFDLTPVDNASWWPDYYLEGNNIVFTSYPASDESNAVTVKFPFKPTRLVLDTDALDDQLYDAEDAIVVRSVYRLLLSKDVSGAFKNIDGWRSQMTEADKVLMISVGNRYLSNEKLNESDLDGGDDVYYI